MPHCDMRFPRSFWKRGSSAFELAVRAERWVIDTLNEQEQCYLSLRKSSEILEVSHKTLLRWVDDGLIKRHGSRKKFNVAELICFLQILIERKKIPPAKHLKLGRHDSILFGVLANSRFSWSRQERSLTPCEIAERIGCHPSTIIRAILSKSYLGTRRTPSRWEIKRKHWELAFPFTIYHPKKK